jgi:hypothetical protein
VEALGLAEFFGNGSVGAPRSKQRSNGNNTKDIARLQQAGQTELQIEDVSPNQPRICTPTPRNVADEDDMTADKDNIDGETRYRL